MGSKGSAKRKRQVPFVKVLILLVILGGILAVFYSPFSERWNEMHVGRLLGDYDEDADELGEEQRAEELAACQAFNEKIYMSPNRWKLPDGLDAEYKKRLGFSDTGVMCAVSVPKIGARVPVYHGTEKTKLQVGAGHMEGSSLPVGGENTHAVIAAHTGMASADLFTRLDEVTEGDLFCIEVLRDKLWYKVGSVVTVLPEEFEHLSIQEGKDLVTLITCTPPGVNSHRLLVTGERTGAPAEEEDEGAQMSDGVKKEQDRRWFLTLLCFGAAMAGYVFLAWRTLTN